MPATSAMLRLVATTRIGNNDGKNNIAFIVLQAVLRANNLIF